MIIGYDIDHDSDPLGSCVWWGKVKRVSMRMSVGIEYRDY